MKNEILYDTPEYAGLSGTESAVFSLKTASGDCGCRVFFKDHSAFTPFHAPYSGIWKSADAKESLVTDFLKDCQSKLIDKGIHKWTIKLAPEFYPVVNMGSLEKAGFTAMYQDLVYFLALQGAFEDGQHNSHRRKLRQLLSEGWVGRQILNPDWGEVHQFIKQSRVYREIPLNISKEKLEQSAKVMPGRYLVFEVYKLSERAAIGVAVKATDTILYHFLPADNPGYQKLSPAILLTKTIFDFGKENQFKYLDLGITSINGKVQESLAIFKQRTGAKQALSTEAYWVHS